MGDGDWRTEPVWLGEGLAPKDAIIWRESNGSWALRASHQCPADIDIARLWQQRTLAQLAGMLPGDDGWPGTAPRGRKKRPGRPPAGARP